jgi:hypothetical protein
MRTKASLMRWEFLLAILLLSRAFLLRILSHLRTWHLSPRLQPVSATGS